MLPDCRCRPAMLPIVEASIQSLKLTTRFSQRSMKFRRDLIYDIGMSEGNDTEFYLRKGFKVIGVEADPVIHAQLKQRFERQIEAGDLTIENKAAAEISGAEVLFYRDVAVQEHSSLSNVHRKPVATLETHRVTTIAWPELVAKHGVPYYAKIDIEGSEPPFLNGLLRSEEYPPYISAEIMNFDPISLLHEVGYTHFRLINQVLNLSFPVPNPAIEGNLVLDPDRNHWSGFFGRELPGRRWFNFDEIRRIHDLASQLWSYETVTAGWLDCHAWMPDLP